MVSTSSRKPTTPSKSSRQAVPMFIEIHGEITADLESLRSAGVCPRCDTGQCLPIPVYERISLDKFDDDAKLSDLKADRGVVRQTLDLVALVEDETQHVIVFVDNDLTASKVRPEKAQWWRALDYVKRECPPKLVGIKHDRLGRRMADIEGLEDLCKETGTRVITLADGDLFANPAWPFLAAMAKAESRNTSFRIKLAQANRRSKGLDAGGGNRPFGYAADRLTIVPGEAATIRRMAQMIADGYSRSAVARTLNAEGISRAYGNKWNAQLVRQTISNPRYAGYRTENGVIVGDGAWAPIIDRDTFRRLDRQLKETATPRGGRPMTSLLGGVARCGYCETLLYGAMTQDKSGAKRPTYKCCRENGGCGRVHRSRSAIDAYVTARVLSLVNADVALNEAAIVRETVDALAQRRVDNDLAVTMNRDEYVAGRLDATAYYARRDVLMVEGRDIEKVYAEAYAELDDLTAETTAGRLWDEWSIDKRRAFIRSKLAAVLVYKTAKRGTAARTIDDTEVKIVPRG